MKTLDEIKQLITAGDTAQADEALKELLAAEPDNLQAKILSGICCLRNDHFDNDGVNLYDELEPEVERRIKDGNDPELERIWNEYRESATTPVSAGPPSMEYVVLSVLIVVATLASVWYFGRELYRQIRTIKLSARWDGSQQVEVESVNEKSGIVEPKGRR
ncbi:MAG: tetratricopeptide repeat protein [Kiritimatiellae bacterium]|nr:tetratricopeptide repeat protein [Kiritimatiellia bacterium]